MNRHPSIRVRSTFAVAVLFVAGIVRAVDVQGVLPASLDQPRIYLAIARDAKSPPLMAKDKGGLGDLLAEAAGEKHKKGDAEAAGTFAVEAFLDTGASGIMISKPTADGLGLVGAKMPGGAAGSTTPIKFFDVGIGGEEPFNVTAPLVVKTSDYGGNNDGEGIERYAPLADGQPVRLRVREDGGLMDQLTGGMDIAGMPAMVGRIMVVDAKPVKNYEKLKTTLVAPGDKTIPVPDVVVPLTYVDFTRFTRIEPLNAIPAALPPSPMIGPDPFNKNDHAKPVTMTHHGKQTGATLLLDTGATSSFISIAKAKELGIVVDASGKLTNVPVKEQFTLPIGGIGGSKEVHGFYVDGMALPATKGEPVRFVHAPVMVMDVSVTDPKTKQGYTLDGALGMNYLVASADITMGGVMGADMGDIHDGAFDGFTVDHVNRTLGLSLKK